MIKVIVISFLSLLWLSSSAQVTVFSDYIDYPNQPKNGVTYHAYDTLYNSSKVAETITWKIIYYSFPTGWSTVGVCDNSTCYQITSTGTHTTTIPAESKITIYSDVNAATNAVSGCAVVRIEVNGNGLTNKVITYSHTDMASATSCHPLAIEDATNNIAVHTSPNPFIDGFNINFNNNSIRYAEVYDIFGKKISRQSIAAGANNYIAMGNKSNGIYMLKIFNANNQLVYSDKLIKK